MSAIVILDNRGFHLRLGGVWHHGTTREESRRLLLDAGIHAHDACLLLESAVWWSEPATVEYRPTGGRCWVVDGRPVTKHGAAWGFRDAGLRHDEIAHLLRICQLCYEIEQRLPPPPSDSMSVEEFRRLLADGLAYALSVRVARRWVRERLRPARCKHPRGLCSWKDQFEHDEPRRHIKQEGFAKVLADAGIKVVGDKVYAKEVKQ